MTQLLVEKGSNPNFQDSLMQSILFYICRDGKSRTFQYLIERNVEFDKPDVYGQTPLYYACRDNRLDIVRKLLQLGANINRVDSIKNQTPLFYAAREGHLEACKMLVEKGANISHTDADNKTAQHYAKKFSKVEVQEYLAAELAKLKEVKKPTGPISTSKDQTKKQQRVKNREVQPKINVRLVYTNDEGVSREVTVAEFAQLSGKLGRAYEWLKNNDSVTPEEIDTALVEPIWEKAAMKVMNACWKARGGNLFHKPVNPAEYGIIDYFDIIKKPMDFSLVKTKLNHNVYVQKQQFLADMSLVFDNCILYNGPENEVSKCAVEIRGIFNEQCKLYGL